MEVDSSKTRARRTTQKKTEQPLWLKLAWAIPKNLVYILVFIIFGAFLFMCWMTYTEQNMTEFLAYDRTREYESVHPLFAKLKKSMDPQKAKVDEFSFSNFTLKQFSTGYVSKNRPVLVKGMADDWNAT